MTNEERIEAFRAFYEELKAAPHVDNNDLHGLAVLDRIAELEAEVERRGEILRICHNLIKVSGVTHKEMVAARAKIRATLGDQQ